VCAPELSSQELTVTDRRKRERRIEWVFLLMPGAVATLVGLTGLRAFSGLVFEPLIVSNAVSYGALGTVLIVQSCLIGVGWVIYAGQLFGRWFYDAWLQALAHRRRGHKEPGGGEEDEQCPGSHSTPPG
jgi:membrane protein